MPRLIVPLLVVTLLIAAPAHAAQPAALPVPEARGNPPQLASVHAAVGPVDSDGTWLAKRANTAVPIASLTKLMTALVVMDAGQALDEWLTVVERTQEAENNAYSRIRIGSELTRENLLRLALMSSENLAAHVVASHYPGGREAFIGAMNDKARELGMSATHFVDPSGLSPDNRSSAADVLTLVRAAYRHEALRRLSTTSYYSARFRSPPYTLGYGNTNALISNPQWPVMLSKTGYLDEAGRCLAMVTEIKGRAVAMVFLNSRGTRSPLGDAGRTRRWLTTGEAGSVAPAARSYEREEAARLEQEGS
ncbi:D-alanyl-D-alanine endopeptidase [Aquisalimonas lutea]|uniref:D-alanyl-D-alanine endopeptidase n=1 Tax=Aquisalimonas lutea TaxID=1327750 RepID=UPI0025B45A28|nr:D-alanyl-D-alanine endopeptidase [Aquisalimonas lutea]MDN3516940.1 D-alanyl-D-alanine endopeptidase [Aquisalimonas lutea]